MIYNKLGNSIAPSLLAFTALVVVPTLSYGAETGIDKSVPNDCRANPGANNRQKSLSEKLDECGGTLRPPRAGDTEMVEPAPKGGTMPIIRPGELPPQ